jgi:UDP-N-acetylmuramate--alanine ligase
MHVYFLGIGGAGTGPLAEIAAQAGFEVSGSDKQNSSYSDYLKRHGISDIEIGQSPDLIKKAHSIKPIDWLVYSPALETESLGREQLEQAKSLGIKISRTDQFVKEIVELNNLKMVAIAGTHGKTTTTAMIAWLFFALNKPQSYLIPAKVNFGEMGQLTKASEYFIYEADEYDRKFLSFEPYLSLISGVSWDHHEIYPNREEYISAFNDFINQSRKTIIWQSDAEYLNADDNNLIVQDDDSLEINDIKLKGLYNRRDAWLAVMAVHELLNAPITELVSAINRFKGLSRRMEEIYPGLYTDYAHTPEKIKGAMSAASEMAEENGQKLVVIYEPLTNRRQIHMLDDYKDCFNGAIKVYWLPSYLAREDPKDPVLSPEQLISHLTSPEVAEPAQRDEKLLGAIREHLGKGDMIVAMAGGGGGSLDEWLRDNFKSS